MCSSDLGTVVGRAGASLGIYLAVSGGAGGDAYQGARAGDGGSATISSTALQGSAGATTMLNVSATGGRGGWIFGQGSGGGHGGASSLATSFTAASASPLNAWLSSYGGDAGRLWDGTQSSALTLGAGGSATLQATLSAGGDVTAIASAYGGAGGGSTLTAGQDTNLLAQRHQAWAVKDGISLFTRGEAKDEQRAVKDTGVKLHAASGNVNTQAQSGPFTLTALKSVDLQSTAADIVISAPKIGRAHV